jgi:hypothetical protein
LISRKSLETTPKEALMLSRALSRLEKELLKQVV